MPHGRCCPQSQIFLRCIRADVDWIMKADLFSLGLIGFLVMNASIVLNLLYMCRVTDAIFQFLLVWYYCTLTIREHILIINGSRFDIYFPSESSACSFCHRAVGCEMHPIS